MMTPAKRDHLAFIAELAASLREAQSRPGLSAEERGRYERWLDHTASLSGLLEAGRPKASRAAELSAHADLPAALLKELSPRQSDQLERQLISVLAACEGTADLDAILIGLYRGFGVIGKRRVIQNKLWRLVRTGRITKAKNKRNVFSLQTEQSGGVPRKRRGERALVRRPPPARRRKLERIKE